MKILSLSLDKKVLDKDSAVAGRVISYGEVVDVYDVLVPSHETKEVFLSGKVRVFGSGGSTKIRQFFNIFKLARGLVKVGQYHLITVQDPYFLALIGLFLARRSKIGWELQVHGFEKETWLRRGIFSFVVKRADGIRVVSQRLKKKLMTEFSIAEDKISVVPIFVENKFVPSERLPEAENKFIFLTVGRLVPVKNIALQIEAIREISAKFPNVELWIVGDGPDREKLEKMASGLPVRFWGWQTNLSRYYFSADVFLLTSYSEGWPLVIMEAAYCGLPIVMTDVGNAGEFIKDGINGNVVPVNNLSALSTAMSSLVSDNSQREKYRTAVLEDIHKLPTLTQTTALYLAGWENIVKRVDSL